MNLEVILIAALFIVGVALLFWFQVRSKEESLKQLQEATRVITEAQKQDKSMQILHQEMNNLREQLDKSMNNSAKLIMESQKTVGERLDRAAAVVGNVQKSLGVLDEATKQVYSVGKDIAQLQEILRAPKMRGSLGELFLGDLLSQILPPEYFTLQHGFKSGEVVDAVVRIGRLVPVDAKFPLDNFQKLISAQDANDKTMARRKFITDVKRHIDAIANKYILPDEETFDFALMYIPAENVYYEIIIKDDNAAEDGSLMSYAFSKRVVPVSPNSFYVYLHTISLGLKGLQIEENARQIIDHLARLKGDFARFRDDFSLVGKHLGSTRSRFDDAEKRLNRFEDKLVSLDSNNKDALDKLTAETPETEPLRLN